MSRDTVGLNSPTEHLHCQLWHGLIFVVNVLALLRTEHVHSRVKRCCMVTDQLRVWKQGIRDLGMDLYYAVHNCRVRLTPWQPMR
jgi:hypothetical protein